MNITIHRGTSSRLPCAVRLFAVTALAAACPAAFSQSTSRESVSSAGVQGDFHSNLPTLSSDGRFVAFQSSASNLVAGDTNFRPDAFVRDRMTGQTTRVSIASSGAQGTGNAELPSISADGRLVAFMSDSPQLAPGAALGTFQIYVHDRLTGQTTPMSTGAGGVLGSFSSHEPSISADGTVVVFESGASNLVAGDTNNAQDVFVHDRTTGQTTRVSLSTEGSQGNGNSGGDVGSRPRLSSDGRFVAFQSRASNLVAGDTNGASDVFVHDRQTAQTTRVSVSSAGAQAAGESINPSVSADGNFVAFTSTAANLVVGDANGATPDIFLRDRQLGQTTVVSVASNGIQGNSQSGYPAVSADGTVVAFWSSSTNLVASPDVNGAVTDVFVRDRAASTTTIASITTGGVQGDLDSRQPEISADGRYVAFDSLSALVAGDNNTFYDVFLRDRGPPPPILGDLNGDGHVDGNDLGTLLGQWGPCVGCPADFNGDGVVDGDDLGDLLGAWTG